ncbi:hypothetical protein B1R32_11552 [Abditibacterium utsteinense]|uniref:Putative nickel insertion protein n=1 Tax=Abditibacterium utsteinense TaxID=1960156 RepID=A0A2S8SQT3_9BACT|nr:nickel pincer cofactor biosynthesis protein LarC [Abditibacterium utsteinense]PQV63145.1 hypothetical protein B1R32_11552 [Abditibacterium utsteinense]
MKIAYFDCFSGIAGDMALAALLDCGVPLAELKKGLASLQIEGWDITSEDVLRSGIHAKSVRVLEHGISDEAELAAAHAHDYHHEHSHGDGDHHEDSHSHEHEHSHQHAPHHHGRSMREIREIIEASELSAKVKSDSLKIFEKIAVAEAYLHHSTPDDVHFHEIGGLDSLLDIVGVAWCLDYLGVEKITASALPLSSGFVKCAHGLMPVPAPATLEMLKNVPWIPTEIRGELVTPTGAGILAALSSGFGTSPALSIEKIGLGAGKREFADRPNILRVSVGETSEISTKNQSVSTKNEGNELGLEWTTLSLLETNIDDMNPQLFESVFERLFETGALDVWMTPIAMKKGRAAQKLAVLCEESAKNALLTAILRETTTLGVRIQSIERAGLKREFEVVSTRFGEVRVKVALWDEENLRRAHPEWDDVKRLAKQSGASAREVFEAAVKASF